MAHGAAFVAGENEVIQHRDIHRFPDQGKPAGDGAVDRARRRVAGRVIVGEDQPGAAVNGRVEYDPADGQRGTGLLAVMAREMDATGLIVDMRDPQMLAGRIALGEQADEEPPGRLDPVQTQRFGTLMKHDC